MSEENRQDPLAKVETERRDFLKKIAIAAAFAAPTIATFSVDGMRKKAFAQAQYDAPEVLSLLRGSDNQAIVTFTQPMDTGSGSVNDASRQIDTCRYHYTNPTVSGLWSWVGDTQQKFEIPGCVGGSVDLTVFYNASTCTGKFKGKNGLDLVPWTGSVTISGVICT